MKLSLIIDSKPLIAAKHFVSTDSSRYTMNGVLAEIEETSVTFVGCNGRILFACRIEPNEITGFEQPMKVIIPASLLRFIKTKKSDSKIWFIVEDGSVTLSSGLTGAFFTDKAINGNFPVWRNVVPKGMLALAPVCINPELMAPFIAATKTLRLSSKNSVSVDFWCQDGKLGNPFVVRPHGLGDYKPLMMLMPMHERDEAAMKIPAWAMPPAPTEPATQTTQTPRPW